MFEKPRSGSVISALSLGAGLLGASCSGSAVSPEQDSAAFNLGHCYGDGTDCVEAREATVATETEIRDCPETQVGTLEEEQRFEGAPSDFVMTQFRVGPDGSVWALSAGFEQATVVVARWSPEGTFSGVSEPLARQAEHTTLHADLALDGAGHALVSIYSVYAPTADDPLTERLTIHVLDDELRAVREPTAFRGSGDSFVSGGAGDSFTLTGDALANAPRGALAHVTAGELDWIQTAVPSSGAGAGVGVSALAVSADGQASVLAQRNGRWVPGTPDIYSYGVARFDDAGNLLWNLVLPTAYGGGWPASMASTPGGDLVVRGVVTTTNTGENKVLLQLLTREGQLGWAFRLRAGLDEAVDVNASGRTVTSSANSVVLISADGQTCKLYGLTPSPAGLTSPSGVVASDSSIYSAFEGGVRRFAMPAE